MGNNTTPSDSYVWVQDWVNLVHDVPDKHTGRPAATPHTQVSQPWQMPHPARIAERHKDLSTLSGSGSLDLDAVRASLVDLAGSGVMLVWYSSIHSGGNWGYQLPDGVAQCDKSGKPNLLW